MVLGLQTWSSIISRQSDAQLETEKGPKYETREPSDRSEMLAREVDI